MSEVSRFATGVTSAVLATELLFVAGSIPTDTAEFKPTEVTAEQPAPEKNAYDKYYDLPNTPCSLYGGDEQEENKCLDVHRNTRIALVNFDFTSGEAEAISVQMKPAFDTTTGNVFNAQPEVIPASDAAKALAKENRGSLDCVKDFAYFGSVAAQQTMLEELNPDKYDMVVALTKARACPDENKLIEVGRAESTPGRYADVMAGTLSIIDKQNTTLVGNIAAHEASHLAGAAHESLLGCTLKGRDALSIIGIYPDESIDISARLQQEDCFLEEYSPFARSVMGSADSRTKDMFRSNPPQVNSLITPEVRKGLAAPLNKDITPEGASITADEARNNKYVSVPIPYEGIAPTPTELHHSKLGNSKISPQELFIVPKSLGEGPDARIGSIDIGFSSTDKKMIDIGRLTIPDNSDYKWNFSYNGNQVQVNLENNVMKVRSLS